MKLKDIPNVLPEEKRDMMKVYGGGETLSRNAMGHNDCRSEMGEVEIGLDRLKMKDIMNTKCYECKFCSTNCYLTCSILSKALVDAEDTLIVRKI